MQALLNFFETIGDIIVSLVEFVISFFSDVVWIIETLVWAVGQFPVFLGWIPGPIQAVILITLSVVVIYKIMGREG